MFRSVGSLGFIEFRSLGNLEFRLFGKSRKPQGCIKLHHPLVATVGIVHAVVFWKSNDPASVYIKIGRAASLRQQICQKYLWFDA